MGKFVLNCLYCLFKELVEIQIITNSSNLELLNSVIVEYKNSESIIMYIMHVFNNKSIPSPYKTISIYTQEALSENSRNY